MSLKSVKTFLANSATIANLVGSGLFPLQAKQGATLPYIVLDVVADSPEYELAGESGLSRLTAQIDCYAGTYADVIELGDATRNRLSGYRGLLDETAWCTKSTMIRSNTLVETKENGSDEQVYRRSMDFEIVYGRTVPDFT